MPARPPAPTLCGMRTLYSRTFIVVWAGIAALLIWLVQGPLTGVDLVVRNGNGTTSVGLVAVVAVAVGAGLVGWALLALLERFTTRARRVWTVVAVAVLLLSFAGPLGSATTLQAKGALAAMHAVVGVILIAGLYRTSRPHPTRQSRRHPAPATRS
jgi:hypothetical protein